MTFWLQTYSELYLEGKADSSAYPQREIGRPANPIMDRTMSNKIRFLLSDTPLCCSILGGVHWERIIFSSRYVINSLDRYSLSRSDRRVLIHFLIYFFTSLWYHLNISNDSDLCLIKKIKPYLERLSINVMKYLYPPLALIVMDPHTSVYMRLRSSIAHSPFPVKGDLVILPSKQDS